MNEPIILERREYEGSGQVFVRKMRNPITKTAMNLIKFRVQNAPDLRYFQVDEENYQGNEFEIERVLESRYLDKADMDAYGLTEIR